MNKNVVFRQHFAPSEDQLMSAFAWVTKLSARGLISQWLFYPATNKYYFYLALLTSCLYCLIVIFHAYIANRTFWKMPFLRIVSVLLFCTFFYLYSGKGMQNKCLKFNVYNYQTRVLIFFLSVFNGQLIYLTLFKLHQLSWMQAKGSWRKQ